MEASPKPVVEPVNLGPVINGVGVKGSVSGLTDGKVVKSWLLVGSSLF